jgi:hypothetical protein
MENKRRKRSLGMLTTTTTHEVSGLLYHTNWNESRRRVRIQLARQEDDEEEDRRRRRAELGRPRTPELMVWG